MGNLGHRQRLMVKKHDQLVSVRKQKEKQLQQLREQLGQLNGFK